MKRTLSILLLLVTSANMSLIHAQEKGISRKQQEKIQAKKEKEDKKAQKKAEKENRARHLKIQDKPTRKRIKKNLKRTKRTGQTGHRQPFYKRWFRKKR